MLLLVLAAVVAVGAIAAVVLVATSGNGPVEQRPSAGSARTADRAPAPSPTPPDQVPTAPSGPPADPYATQSPPPSPAGDDVPYYLLRAGDCFDTSEDEPGRATRRPCSAPHDAEVVEVTELEGARSTDAAIAKAASALCEGLLERKAARQPAGTVRGTLVQYPDSAGFEAGIDAVACSLAADIGDGGRTLTRPLE
ncbi:hypothetical protein [Streptomyces minutiscleroticus]|uniref:hypothetical protein n=1 Tax=Streptomyces minutiscleroticus TaxID=68238 RepID=UPI00167C97F5|nr:hypothetical protein [Streptomyces minutiscleroticus]